MMIALAEAFKAGLLRREHLIHDVRSGVMVGFVALPLVLAIAIASGARPEQGVYTAIIAGLVASLLGGTRAQISGPAGALVVILSTVMLHFGYEGVQIASIMAGFILLIMGMTGIGRMVKFIPYPFTAGLVAGIALLIAVGQCQVFLGLHLPTVEQHFHLKILALLFALPTLTLSATLMSCFALILIIATPRLTTRVPGPLVALLAATLLQAIFQFEGIETIGTVFGGISRGLPSIHLPDVTLYLVRLLIGPAVAIALLVSIESLLSAVVADGMTGTHHNSNQELAGQGVANVLAPLLGGFASSGAIARTATNVKNGGSSPFAGVIHALVLLGLLLLLAPYAVHVPLGALAAVLLVVAYNISEAKHFFQLLRNGRRSDVAVMLTTFGLTVFVDIVIAVYVGFVLATLLFMRRILENGPIPGGQPGREQGHLELPPGVMIYSIDGPFFFGAAETFEATMASVHGDVKTLIIRLDKVPFIDATSIHAFGQMLVLFRNRGTRTILCEAQAAAKLALDEAGILDDLGEENVVDTLNGAIHAAKKR